jgi:hypothetical protein
MLKCADEAPGRNVFEALGFSKGNNPEKVGNNVGTLFVSRWGSFGCQGENSNGLLLR